MLLTSQLLLPASFRGRDPRCGPVTAGDYEAVALDQSFSRLKRTHFVEHECEADACVWGLAYEYMLALR